MSVSFPYEGNFQPLLLQILFSGSFSYLLEVLYANIILFDAVPKLSQGIFTFYLFFSFVAPSR